MKTTMYHYEDSARITALPATVFDFVDDFRRFSSHMSESSWMMGGGTMNLSLDSGEGKRVGSIVSMGGKIFGIYLSLEEVVTVHEPPYRKEWETIGMPRLLVIGHYRMALSVVPDGNSSVLRVSIDYKLPKRNQWMGRLFGSMYATWCVRQMTDGVRKHFANRA